MKIHIYAIGQIGSPPHGEEIPSFRDMDKTRIKISEFLITQGYERKEIERNPGFYEGALSTPTVKETYIKNRARIYSVLRPVSFFDASTVLEIVLAGKPKTLEEKAQAIKNIQDLPPGVGFPLSKDFGEFEVDKDFDLNKFDTYKELLNFFDIKLN